MSGTQPGRNLPFGRRKAHSNQMLSHLGPKHSVTAAFPGIKVYFFSHLYM